MIITMSEKEDLLSGLLMELRRGTIVLSVLRCLKTPVYGYSLVQTLAEKNLPIEANTLYPLLRRLEKQGLLKSEWETSGAKPRKYYQVTGLGSEIEADLSTQWSKLVCSMEQL